MLSSAIVGLALVLVTATAPVSDEAATWSAIHLTARAAIEAGGLAQTRAKSPEVRNLGRLVIFGLAIHFAAAITLARIFLGFTGGLAGRAARGHSIGVRGLGIRYRGVGGREIPDSPRGRWRDVRTSAAPAVDVSRGSPVLRRRPVRVYMYSGATERRF